MLKYNTLLFTTDSPSSGRVATPLVTSLHQRMQGPGGYYNLGNAFGLLTGLLLHMAAVASSDVGVTSSLHAISDYLAGSTSAIALSVSMLIFFWSGELYYRAWRNGFPPVAKHNRAGDLWSCWGALVLGVGLLLLGQPVLALTAGLLHGIGKLGSAWSLRAPRQWHKNWPDFWRSMVLLSRVPALIAVLLEILSHTLQGTLLSVSGFGPLTLLVCYLLWVKADLLLFTD
ncbi:MAG: hypothetical protein AAF404_01585 [Pseudomonadota bacterium]